MSLDFSLAHIYKPDTNNTLSPSPLLARNKATWEQSVNPESFRRLMIIFGTIARKETDPSLRFHSHQCQPWQLPTEVASSSGKKTLSCSLRQKKTRYL